MTRLRLVAALCLVSMPAFAYRLEGAKWPVSAMPVAWSLDADAAALLGPNTTVASAKAAAVAGFTAWHNVSNVRLDVAAPSDLARGARSAGFDQVNKLYWVDANDCYGGAACSSKTTASTCRATAGCTWGWQYDSGTLGVTTPIWYQGQSNILDADIEFNGRDYRWQTGTGSYATCNGCLDTLSIAVHEEGHFIGIGHSCEVNEIGTSACNATENAAVMLAAYPGFPKQSLQADDIAAVRALYPAPTPGSGQQGYSCTQDVDCANPLKCRNAQGGGNRICTQVCASAGAACPAGLSCLAANTGFACLSPLDDAGDLCKACASGQQCSSGQCVQTADFAFCSRACSAQSACPGSGYVCVGVQNNQGVTCQSGMTNCFCAPGSMTCPNNCDASRPCPTGQTCTSGMCKYAPGGQDQACPTGSCQAGLLCVGSSEADATCRKACTPGGANVCPSGQSCYTLTNGSGACFPGGGTVGEGQACGNAACSAGLVCVGSSAADAVCRRVCNPASPACPSGTACQTLTDGSGACFPGSNPTPTGADECQACGGGVKCKTGLLCVAGASGATCRRGCNSQGACGATQCEATSGIPNYSGVCSCGPAPSPEGGPCAQDAECQSPLICVADRTQPVGACRSKCATDAECGANRHCATFGSAKVCEPGAPSGGTDGGTAGGTDAGSGGGRTAPGNTGCGCSAGGSGLLASMVMLLGAVRRRRVSAR